VKKRGKPLISTPYRGGGDDGHKIITCYPPSSGNWTRPWQIVREFGMNATAARKRLNSSQPAVSISVRRGEKISRDRAITLTAT